MANTFLHAQGIEVGKSLAENDLADTARGILDKAERAELRDHPAGRCRRARTNSRPTRRSHAYGIDAIPADGMILDIGPQIDRARSTRRIDDAATLVWNGPLGAFEMQPFDTGHGRGRRICGAERTKAGKLVSVAGGGDTVAALESRRRRGRVHLCLHRRRRLPGMDGGQALARRRGVAGKNDAEADEPDSATGD